jgi:hypothetical protein
VTKIEARVAVKGPEDPSGRLCYRRGRGWIQPCPRHLDWQQACRSLADLRCSLPEYCSRLPSIGGTHPFPERWPPTEKFNGQTSRFSRCLVRDGAQRHTRRMTPEHSVGSMALRRPFLIDSGQTGRCRSPRAFRCRGGAPGDIAPGTSAPPSSHAIGSSGVTPPTVGAPGLAGVYAPGQAAPASRTAVVPPTEAVVGPGPSVSLWPGSGFGRVYGPFPVGQGGLLSVGQALPLNIVPTALPDQPRNGVAVVNGHRLILERGTNRIIQDLD